MSTPSRTRPFRVLGIQQVAIGGEDKGALRAFWSDLLGIPATGTYRSESHNVDEDILEVGAGAATVEVDLMQPLDPEKRPRVHEPALNHVGLWVDDVQWGDEPSSEILMELLRPPAAPPIFWAIAYRADDRGRLRLSRRQALGVTDAQIEF